MPTNTCRRIRCCLRGGTRGRSSREFARTSERARELVVLRGLLVRYRRTWATNLASDSRRSSWIVCQCLPSSEIRLCRRLTCFEGEGRAFRVGRLRAFRSSIEQPSIGNFSLGAGSGDQSRRRPPSRGAGWAHGPVGGSVGERHSSHALSSHGGVAEYDPAEPPPALRHPMRRPCC